ncbi:serine hydrolase domain-containing protein [Microbacterium sp. KSW-18]|uniref:Serine hydrolase domain-containing protein n=1 Tax=Microbacterium aquilitoris TaxID=3067307 RepID=A0ABU3GEM1_9MICO|nr:serine hydrolase domain-containing protein [Microbacterium sp. KSW-18]MDT3329140.1 serine hydrolase domain-containing protein [Microbacterium sp. KSW-18]
MSAAFDRVRGHVDAGRLPSAVLGVATAEGTVALEGFGAAASDRYPLFSITKPLLGIAAARAIERGLLTTETPLRDAVPEFGAGRDDVVLLRHLASHTAGIAEPPLDPVTPLREELVTRGRDFAAGSASRYSSLAFEGIAALVEHATGHDWADAVAQWAGEIGADGLSLDHAGSVEVVDAAASGVDMARFAALRHPGAGLVGRAEDLLRLGSELLRIEGGATGGVLQPATLAMMRRPLTGDIPRLEPYIAERGQDWGFTWNLRSRAPGLIDQDVYGHGGWAGTEFWVHPSAGIAWVLLTNAVSRPGVDLDALDNAVVSAR